MITCNKRKKQKLQLSILSMTICLWRVNGMKTKEIIIKEKIFWPWNNLLFTRLGIPTNCADDDCVNPPRHVVFSTSSPQVMLISVSIKMFPFWLVRLRAYFPNTLTVEPLLNSISPLNVILAARWSPCEELLFWSDALKVQAAQLVFTIDGAVVLISSTSPLFSMSTPARQRVKVILIIFSRYLLIFFL